jgi:uncharacterized phiE125 gp8 family phage protein
MLILPTKAPNEVLTYTIDWTERLNGDTLSGVPTVTVTGAVKDGQSNTPSSVTIKISGGATGTIARVEAHAVTAAGNTIDDIAMLPIGGDPISLDEAREQVGLTADDTSHDAKLIRLIQAAVSRVEALTGTRLLTQSAVRKLAAFADPVPLPIAPVQAIVVTYLDTDGATQTLDAASYNLLTSDRLQPKIERAAGTSWPILLAHREAVTLTMVAGYGDPLDLPAAVRLALLQLVALWFDNRGDSAAPGSMTIPPGVFDLIAAHRRIPGL